MRFIITLFSMIVTFIVVFVIWDVSRFIYKKFKNLVVSVWKLRYERKHKKPVHNVESIQSNVTEQYSEVLKKVGE